MAVPYTANLPEDLDLAAGYTIRFTALNATTGAVDTNVVVSEASIFATPLGSGTLSAGPFMLVPGPENG